ncbi:MAG TPA: transporter substrate-binding domain-containing protein [Xanthobacteraceae bacterium]|jgi:polar amino acid transport system substrate-binding protein|nr:transporter substrate-binding domain-containing protein [Xanthobacteraceae bacterium]
MQHSRIWNFRISFAAAALLASIGAAGAQRAADPRVADLVQAGKVRVGLFSTQYTKDTASGELMGVRVEIARTLAARIGVPAALLEHGTPPDVVACLKAGACDVAFLPRDERSAGIGDFSPPYLQSEYTMLVPADSSIHSLADADKSGLRIAAVRNHSSTMTLTSAIKQADVILGENELVAFELLRAGRADAFASTRQYLLRAAKNLPGSRVLAEYYGANLNRVVVPKGHAGWLSYVTSFVEEAKASGLVQKAIDRDGTFAFQVPPPGDPD